MDNNNFIRTILVRVEFPFDIFIDDVYKLPWLVVKGDTVSVFSGIVVEDIFPLSLPNFSPIGYVSSVYDHVSAKYKLARRRLNRCMMGGTRGESYCLYNTVDGSVIERTEV